MPKVKTNVTDPQTFLQTDTELASCRAITLSPYSPSPWGLSVWVGDPKAAGHFHMGAGTPVTLSKAVLPPLHQPAVPTQQGKQRQAQGQNHCSLRSAAWEFLKLKT